MCSVLSVPAGVILKTVPQVQVFDVLIHVVVIDIIGGGNGVVEIKAVKVEHAWIGNAKPRHTQLSP
jgi:hypothetical protein